jgi:hypothetical protein
MHMYRVSHLGVNDNNGMLGNSLRITVTNETSCESESFVFSLVIILINKAPLNAMLVL